MAEISSHLNGTYVKLLREAARFTARGATELAHRTVVPACGIRASVVTALSIIYNKTSNIKTQN